MSKVRHYTTKIKSLWRRFVAPVINFLGLSFRGVTVIGFIIWAWFGVGGIESDIIAKSAAMVFFVFFILVIIVAKANFLSLKSTIKGQVTSLSSESDPALQLNYYESEIATRLTRAKEPQLVLINISGIKKLYPLLQISLQLETNPEKVRTKKHLILGAKPEERTLRESITFPHRGEWQVSVVKVELSDVFGITNWSLEVPVDCTCQIAPGKGTQPPQTILSSTVKPGEALTHQQNREGDPYDLKPYHPADGVKKLAWKIFARTGELVARRAEPAASPEGKTILFALANENEDYVCSTILDYLRMLNSQEIEVQFGCTGMGPHLPACNLDQARDLLVSSVWEAKKQTNEIEENVLDAFLKEVVDEAPSASIQNILIAIGSQRFANPQTLEHVKRLVAICDQYEIRANFAICNFPDNRPTTLAMSGGFQALVNWIWNLNNDYNKSSRLPENYINEFYALTNSNGWKVIS